MEGILGLEKNLCVCLEKIQRLQALYQLIAGRHMELEHQNSTFL